MKKYFWPAILALLLFLLAFLGYLLQSPRVLPIHTVTVVGAPPANQAMVAKRIQAVTLGTLITSNAEELAERLEIMPWVRAAVVQKIWPDQLLVTIYPQKFVAIWNGHQALNADGQLLPLPQNLDALSLNLYGPDEEALTVLAYAQAFQGILSPLSLTVVQVSLDDTGSWSLVLDNGMKIQLGDRQVLTRLGAFVKVYGQVFEQSQRKAISVDLRYSNGMAVEWAN